MIEVSINDESKTCSVDTTIKTLLESCGFASDQIAVAVNAEFVPRSNYTSRRLNTGDQVEVLVPVQGG